jgi:hypothetical protein
LGTALSAAERHAAGFAYGEGSIGRRVPAHYDDVILANATLWIRAKIVDTVDADPTL